MMQFLVLPSQIKVRTQLKISVSAGRTFDAVIELLTHCSFFLYFIL